MFVASKFEGRVGDLASRPYSFISYGLAVLSSSSLYWKKKKWSINFWTVKDKEGICISALEDCLIISLFCCSEITLGLVGWKIKQYFSGTVVQT